MKINRRNLKWRARDAMRAARPNALLMTLVYLLLTSGLGLAVTLLADAPLDRVLYLYQQGLTLDRAIPLALAGVGGVGLFLNILMAICGVVMDFGYRRWSLNTARGKQGELSDLIEGFSMVGRILWLRVLVLVYSFLWYLAIFMPATLGVLIGPWVSVTVFVIAFVAWFSRILRYSMAAYCLADEPELGASWALRRSRQMMQGRVKDYVLLMLSFIGWFLLGGLIVTAVEGVLVANVGGVQMLVDPQAAQVVGSSVFVSVLPALASWPLDLWLKPYVTMTECKFYEQIKDGPERVSV